MKLVYLILYTDTINEFACEAEWWIRLITVDSPEQLEAELRKDDVVGWIHLVGISPESPSVVVQRALDHPDKISIVASNVPQLIEQFAQQLTSAESNLFVWLRRLEHPGAQIRNALRTRPPYCYTWHILKHLFPDVGGNDKTLASLLVHLFIDQEREFTLDTMCDEDRSAHHRCWEKVRKRKDQEPACRTDRGADYSRNVFQARARLVTGTNGCVLRQCQSQNDRPHHRRGARRGQPRCTRAHHG
jgi:hypothetical protein